MTAPTPTYKPGAVLVLPFPFTDKAASKRRPAVVLSSRAFNREAGHFIAAMVTSAEHEGWPEDVPVGDLDAAGLAHESVVRMKLFTLDERLVLRQAGVLSTGDWSAVTAALARVMPTVPTGGVHEPATEYRS